MSSSRVLSNFIWRLLERFGAQGVTFIVSLVLARILGPEVYGTVAIVLVFIAIFDVFVDSGLGNALIQKKNADDVDFSSVFYFNIAACIVLYLIVFLFAPVFALLYKNDLFVPVLRVMGLELVISGFKNIQFAYVSRHMEFKKFFFATLTGTIIAAPIGIVMALRGYGVWAIVAQNLFNVTIDTIILWVSVKWRPKKVFSWKKLKVLLNYGWKLLASSLLETVYQKLRQLIIGRRYSATDLAYYNKGETFPSTAVNNVNSAMNSVLFPIMSENQDSPESIKEITKKSIRVGSYVLMPMMAGLAACAEPLVKILLGEAWLPCVPYLQVFCFVYAFYPFHVANLNAIKAVGRSDIYLKQEITKKVVGISAIVITMRISVFAIALGLVFTDLIDQIINSFPNGKLINYAYKEQLEDLAGPFFLSIMMGGIVYLISFVPISSFLQLIIQIPLGIVLYVALSKLYKLDIFNYLISSVRMLLKRQ